jgi:TonB-linked SusC/RagA family outer membrane protein
MMRMRRPMMLALACGLYVPTALQAQTGSITGVVTDSRTGAPIVAAQISIDQLNKRTNSDVDGRYRMTEVPVGTHVVQVTNLGYSTFTRDVTVAPGDNRLDITLNFDPLKLDEILVSAQQIERQSRELAYSVSRITGEDVTRARETNFVTALAGKAPGVEVLTQSGNIGASTRIVIRGISSLSGDNQPLFVVDGVPISNANIVDNASQSRLNGAIDVGNRAADLNPDDIESVTILRGAAAAALYGQRAKDGVVLVTTKRGRDVAGQTVTVSSSLRFSNPLVLPSFQNEFAQGNAGAYSSTDLNGWGPRIAGQRVTDIRGDSVTLQAYPDNVSGFYDDAILSINSFSVSAADDRADFRLGFTHQHEEGIVPNNRLKRQTVNLNTGYQLTPRLHARLSGSYSTTDGRGRAVQGGNDPNVLTSLVNGLPRTFDISTLKDYKDESGNQRALSNFINNPYWVINENLFTNEVERVFGNSTAIFSPLDWLSLTGRWGIDFYTEDRKNVNAVGTIGRDRGLFTLDVIQERQINIDLQSEARHQLDEDISLRGIVGFNINRRRRDIQRNLAQDLTVPALYTFSNAESNTPANQLVDRGLYGVYADATFGYRNYLFINATGRNDWSSTLPKDNNSFFYPSINVSFVATDAVQIAPSVLSYAKLRANYAHVGSDEDPYQLAFRFFPVADAFGQFGTDLTFPFGGRTAFEATSTIPPTNLKPQDKASFEIGGEFQFLEGRLGLDLTYYDERIKDQILSIPVPQSTGFAFNRTNIGEVSNRGIEAQMNITPVRSAAIDWNVFLNFTRNRNRVESLAEGVEELTIESGYDGLQVKAEPGKAFGLYGAGFLRDSVSGKVIIDPATGLRQNCGCNIRLADIDPDFRLSLNNTVSFRGVSLSGLVDWRKGGQIYSGTVASLRRDGLAEETTVNREGTFIDDGVIVNADGTTRPNDVPVQNMQAFWTRYASQSIHEGNIFDATNVRLREVRVDYTLPRSWFTGTPIGSVSVGLEGRNLLLLYRKTPHIDPETGLFGSASNGQGIEFNTLPSTRSFGLNLQARF